MLDIDSFEILNYLEKGLKENTEKLEKAVEEENIEEVKKYSIKLTNFYSFYGSLDKLVGKAIGLALEEGYEDDDISEPLSEYLDRIGNILERIEKIDERMRSHLKKVKEEDPERAKKLISDGYKSPIYLDHLAEETREEIEEVYEKSLFEEAFGEGALPGELEDKTEKSGMYG